MIAVIATSGLFAASLSVTSLLPEKLVIKVDDWSSYSETNNVTITGLADRYRRITVFSGETIVFDQDVLLKEGYLTDITINRFGTPLIDQKIEDNVVDNWNIWDW